MKHFALRTLTALLTLTLLLLPLAACTTEEAKGGYTFKTPGGVELTVGDAAEGLSDRLGAAQSVTESASCGLPGTDRLYAYSGFRVKTTPSEQGDIICQIELTDDSLKTPEGLYIGMSAEDAKTAMSGKGTATTVGDGFSYTKDGVKLQVTVRDGAVSAITYLEG